MRPSVLHNILIDFNDCDLAGCPDEMCHQRRVVAGPSSDLEHTLSGLEMERLQHHGHERRHRGGTESFAIPLTRYYVCIGIRSLGLCFGYKQMAWDGTKRLFNRRGLD